MSAFPAHPVPIPTRFALTDHGIDVVEQVSHEALPGYYNRDYLTAKRDRLGHTLQRLG